jgi:hypothetical protein
MSESIVPTTNVHLSRKSTSSSEDVTAHVRMISTATKPRRRSWSSCCWPLSSHHWYKPVVPTRPDIYIAHSLCRCSCWCADPSVRKSMRSLVQYTLLGFVLFIIVLWLGVEYEQYHVRQADDTSSLYNQQSAVCGIVIASNETANHLSSFRIETFSSTHALNETTSTTDPNATVITAHCGDCGACSTPHDIHLYDETSNTLLSSSTKCAKRALVWGRKTASTCMTESVGFTPPCNECWVENIMCDLRKCIFTCLWFGLFSEIDGDGSGTSSKALNPCTLCDEKRCGPTFIRCAGANRRRSGILSDIERNDVLEVCPLVSPKDWWKDPTIQQQWAEYEMFNGTGAGVSKDDDSARVRSI